MREHDLQVRQKRRVVPRTTQADKASHPSPNLLDAYPAPARPSQTRVTDITDLPTGEGWLYVAAEMDLYSRRIIAWDNGPSLTFRRQLAQQGRSRSMLPAGNCEDNAAIDSFSATLKTGCFGTTIPETRAEAPTMLIDRIETSYNPVRLPGSLNILSPLAFEKSSRLN
jgi:putative transposase